MEKEFEQMFKKHKDILQILNWLKDLSEEQMDGKYFVSRYLCFFYDESLPQQDVIKYIKPPRKTTQQLSLAPKMSTNESTRFGSLRRLLRFGAPKLLTLPRCTRLS